ncbi:unnamed protein product [Onchocerca flexuosa]|uniref:Chitin-binding type-2 domain-containing protein n=1 Tax=Onchocerca flexuosa TaxID=387005 RepID=A0A3P7YWM9_9BILA|nr:unnamed protein product [Onchocerca flexuosa]
MKFISDIKCPESFGYFQHPNDCHLFIHCAHYHPYVKPCPPNTFFNDEIKIITSFSLILNAKKYGKKLLNLSSKNYNLLKKRDMMATSHTV